MRGHQFVETTFHSANCDVCNKHLPKTGWWKGEVSYECQRCHLKCHKEHVDKAESSMQACVGGECLAGEMESSFYHTHTTHTNTHTTHTHTHACMHTHTHTHTHACMHAHTHTHTCMHAHTHTHMHACTHTHTHNARGTKY